MDENSGELVDPTADPSTPTSNFNTTETPVLPIDHVWSNGNSTESNMTDENSTNGHRGHHKKGCKGKFWR